MQGRRSSSRTKSLEIWAGDDDAYEFESTLVDESLGGNYEPSGNGSLIVHHFEIAGTVAASDLKLQRLEVRVKAHPFRECPAVSAAVQALVGLTLAGGWRRHVLERLGGSAGCTHITTLLVGLAEIRTLVFFQEANRMGPYGPDTRASGEWIARNLRLHPDLAGACHALREGSAALEDARDFARGHDD